MTDDCGKRIEPLSNTQAKLEVAELVLKALNINYEIVSSSKPPISKRRSLKYDLALNQIQDILVSSDNESKIYAEKIKEDFEARRYWRKKFKKFPDFKKFIKSN